MNKRGNIPEHEPGSRYSGKKPYSEGASGRRPYSGDAGAWRRIQELSQTVEEPEIEAERLSRGATVFPAEFPELSDSPDEMF